MSTPTPDTPSFSLSPPISLLTSSNNPLSPGIGSSHPSLCFPPFPSCRPSPSSSSSSSSFSFCSCAKGLYFSHLRHRDENSFSSRDATSSKHVSCDHKERSRKTDEKAEGEDEGGDMGLGTGLQDGRGCVTRVARYVISSSSFSSSSSTAIAL